jgi:hypothetical protein
VVLPRLSAHVPLALPGGDDVARVIVGRPGAGKTRYLKELRRRLDEAGTHDLMPLDFGPPSLTAVIRIAEEIEFRPPAERVDVWRKLWKRTITRAVVAQISSEGMPTASFDPFQKDLLGSAAGPRPICSEFDQILNELGSLPQLLRFLDDPRWNSVDAALHDVLEGRPKSLCYFVDIVEDDSAYAPLYWLWCLKGLLRQIIQFIREPVGASDNVRIYLAIRDQAWISLAKLAPSMEQHPSVRLLRWDPTTLLAFFARKILELPDSYRFGVIDPSGSAEDTVAAWLGSSRIDNVVRSIEEPMHSYILRHTRLIPRDIVVAGNALAGEVFLARSRGDDRVDPDGVQLAVAAAGLVAGREELYSCALEIVSSKLAEARNSAERDAVLPDEDAVGRVTDQLGQMLGSCFEDVIKDKELDGVIESMGPSFAGQVDLKALLWRHGLIGWGPGVAGPFRFSYGFGLLGGDAPPPADTYVALHPSLIDATGIRPARAEPVNPYPEVGG